MVPTICLPNQLGGQALQDSVNRLPGYSFADSGAIQTLLQAFPGYQFAARSKRGNISKPS